MPLSILGRTLYKDSELITIKKVATITMRGLASSASHDGESKMEQCGGCLITINQYGGFVHKGNCDATASQGLLLIY